MPPARGGASMRVLIVEGESSAVNVG